MAKHVLIHVNYSRELTCTIHVNSNGKNVFFSCSIMTIVRGNGGFLSVFVICIFAAADLFIEENEINMMSGQSVRRQTQHRTFNWHLNVWMSSMLQSWKTNPTFSWATRSLWQQLLQPSECPCSLFLCRHKSRAQPENEQHDRAASCRFKSGDPSNLPSIHSGRGFIHFLQSRLSNPSWFWEYVSACEGGSVGLARGTIAGGVGGGLWFVCAVL